MSEEKTHEQFLLEQIKKIESGSRTELDLSGLDITRLPAQVYNLSNLKQYKDKRIRLIRRKNYKQEFA